MPLDKSKIPGRNLLASLDSRGKDELFEQVCKTTLFEIDEFTEFWDEAEKGYEYLGGEQFTEAERKWYKSQDRPARVFNMVFPIFTQVLGDFLLNQSKRRVFPLPGGDAQTAGLLQRLLDQMHNDTDLRDEIITIALAGIIKCGYGYPRFSDEKHLEGSVVVGAVDEFEVVFDSRSRHHFLDDAAYVARFRWLEEDDILNGWPEWRSDLRTEFKDRRQDQGWLDRLEPRIAKLTRSREFFDQAAGQHRVIEFHHMEWDNREVFIDLDTGSVEPWILEGEKADFYMRLKPNHMIRRQWVKVKQITEVVPSINFILSHQEAANQDQTLDIIPYSFYRFGKRSIKNFGIFRNVQEPQDDINHWQNRSADIIAKEATPGFTYRPDLLENPQDVELYGTKPNISFAVKNGARLEDAIQVNQFSRFPQGLSQLASTTVELLDKIIGVSPNFFSRSETKSENATLFAQRVQQAQKAFQVGYANFSRWHRRIDNKSIRLMQLFYDTERPVLIAAPASDPEAVILNLQIGQRVLNTLGDIGTYEAIVDEENRNPTLRLVTFQLKTELIDLLARYFPPEMIASIVPWDWYLKDATDLGDTTQLLENIQQAVQSLGVQGEEDEAMGRVRDFIDTAKAQIELENSAGFPQSGPATNTKRIPTRTAAA